MRRARDTQARAHDARACMRARTHTRAHTRARTHTPTHTRTQLLRTPHAETHKNTTTPLEMRPALEKRRGPVSDQFGIFFSGVCAAFDSDATWSKRACLLDPLLCRSPSSGRLWGTRAPFPMAYASLGGGQSGEGRRVVSTYGYMCAGARAYGRERTRTQNAQAQVCTPAHIPTHTTHIHVRVHARSHSHVHTRTHTRVKTKLPCTVATIGAAQRSL